MVAGEQMKRVYELLSPVLDERTRRLVPAAMALASGHGGIAKAARATGVSRRAIGAGITELKHPQPLAGKRTRRPGGGRKPLTARDTTVRGDLERLVDRNIRDLKAAAELLAKNFQDALVRINHHTELCKASRKLRETVEGSRNTPLYWALVDMDHCIRASRPEDMTPGMAQTLVACVERLSPDMSEDEMLKITDDLYDAGLRPWCVRKKSRRRARTGLKPH
jgi:hypothetical protein